eukprot:11163602-Lingulodinium_polyedra.AAC.1
MCFELPGFTSAACRMLREGVRYRTGSRKELRRLGGAGHHTATARENCLQHLRTWCRLRVSIVEV